VEQQRSPLGFSCRQVVLLNQCPLCDSGSARSFDFVQGNNGSRPQEFPPVDIQRRSDIGFIQKSFLGVR